MKHIKVLSTFTTKNDNGDIVRYKAGGIHEVDEKHLEGLAENEDYEVMEREEAVKLQKQKTKEEAKLATVEAAAEKIADSVVEKLKPKQVPPAIVTQLGFSSKRDEFENTFSIARAARSLYDGNWNRHPIEKAWFEEAREVKSTMTAVTDTAGGFAVTPEVSDELFDMTYNKAVVMSCGPSTIPMNTDSLDIAGLTTAATTYWLGEATITGTGVTEDTTTAMGERSISAKTLCVLLPMSNILIADANPRLEAFIKRHLSKQMATKLDEALIQGGTSPRPKSIIAQVSTNTNTTATCATNFSFDVLHDSRYNVQNANYEVDNWIMDPYTLNLARKLTDSTGQYIWQPAVAKGEPSTIHGIPVRVTKNATDAVTSTTHYIIGGQFDEMVIGERQGFALDIDKSYMFNKMTTCLLASIRIGAVLLHENAFHVETLTQ